MDIPAVFLDRDGVIIENRPDYVKSWDEVSLLPGSLNSLRRLAGSLYKIVIVSNQSAVGRGILSIERVREINQRVILEIETSSGRVDASYICPHHPDEKCNCRKPAPGMLNQAKEDLNIDFSRSYLIGDAATDIQAAQSVGVQGILVLTGRGENQLPEMIKAGMGDFQIAPDLNSAVEMILNVEMPL